MATDLASSLAKMADRVITHMNDDHADSILAYAHFYAKLTGATSAKMTGLSVSGFELQVAMADGSTKSNVLVPYDPPLQTAAAVRKVAVTMHFAAYNGMGIKYKLLNGFYTGAARMAWTHMPKRIRNIMIGIPLTIIAAVMLRRLK